MKSVTGLVIGLSLGVVAWVLLHNGVSPVYGRDGTRLSDYVVNASARPGPQEDTYLVHVVFTYAPNRPGVEPKCLGAPTILMKAGTRGAVSIDDGSLHLTAEVLKPVAEADVIVTATVQEGGDVLFANSWQIPVKNP